MGVLPMTARMASGAVVLAAALGLGFALVAERGFDLVPCALCLVARWPYRVAIGLGVLGVVLPSRAWLWAALLCGVAASVIGAVHLGVEQGFWPSPLPECAASRAVIGAHGVADMLARMPALPSKPCDEATYLLPGVSFVTLSALYALAATGTLAMYLRRHRSFA